jgi:hypothetical protein
MNWDIYISVFQHSVAGGERCRCLNQFRQMKSSPVTTFLIWRGDLGEAMRVAVQRSLQR